MRRRQAQLVEEELRQTHRLVLFTVGLSWLVHKQGRSRNMT